MTDIVENKRDVSISTNSSRSNAEASFHTAGRTGYPCWRHGVVIARMTCRMRLARHAIVFSCIGTAALAGSALFGPGSTELHIKLLIVFLPFVGIPHGTLDYALARKFLQPRIGKGWALYFLATYMMTMAVVLVAWWIHPVGRSKGSRHYEKNGGYPGNDEDGKVMSILAAGIKNFNVYFNFFKLFSALYFVIPRFLEIDEKLKPNT